MIFKAFQKISALFISVIITLCNWLNIPIKPMGQKLDLSGYTLVFCDEFDKNELDTSVWHHRAAGSRRSGFNASSQVVVENGVLKLTAEYLENGEFGAGWYSGMIALNQLYKNGYFEIKCTCASGAPFWSAFWLQSGNSYDHNASDGGIGGAEIDIFEAYSNSEKSALKYNSVATNIHCNGGDDNPEKIDSKRLGHFRGNDIYNTFNTYGLEWTEDEYIFYINGVETTRSTFSKGVSQVPEEIIVSLEIDDDINLPMDFSTVMTVDYVKIYQKP